MSRFWPTTLVKWREPPDAHRAREAIQWQSFLKFRKRYFLIVLVGLLLCLTLGHVSAWLDPRNEEPWVPWHLVPMAALVCAILFSYTIPDILRYMESRLASEVSVTDWGITTTTSSRMIDYESIRHCQILRHAEERENLSLLVIQHEPVRGKAVTTIYGIDPTVDVQRLKEILEDRAVPIEARSQDSMHPTATASRR
jgi:hypothetical protein